MRGNFRHIYLNILIMLAVIGAGISPACKFISGQQTWLEICGAEGIKKILIAHDEVPQNQKQEHANSDPCAFCLTHASVKVIGATPVGMAMPAASSRALVFEQRGDNPVYDIATNLSARGPPILL